MRTATEVQQRAGQPRVRQGRAPARRCAVPLRVLARMAIRVRGPAPVDGLDQITRALGGLTRDWRFDRMATVISPGTGKVSASFAGVAKRYGVAVRPVRRGTATARASSRRPTTWPPNGSGGPCPTTCPSMTSRAMQAPRHGLRKLLSRRTYSGVFGQYEAAAYLLPYRNRIDPSTDRLSPVNVCQAVPGSRSLSDKRNVRRSRKIACSRKSEELWGCRRSRPVRWLC